MGGSCLLHALAIGTILLLVAGWPLVTRACNSLESTVTWRTAACYKIGGEHKDAWNSAHALCLLLSPFAAWAPVCEARLLVGVAEAAGVRRTARRGAALARWWYCCRSCARSRPGPSCRRRPQSGRAQSWPCSVAGFYTLALPPQSAVHGCECFAAAAVLAVGSRPSPCSLDLRERRQPLFAGVSTTSRGSGLQVLYCSRCPHRRL